MSVQSHMSSAARILLVEDDNILRRCLRIALEKESCQVVEAGCVEEAKEKILVQQFNLIVTDYDLGPGRSGLILLEDLQKQRHRAPVILISGSSAEWLEPVARRLGACSFLKKPFTLETFLQEAAQAVKKIPADVKVQAEATPDKDAV